VAWTALTRRANAWTGGSPEGGVSLSVPVRVGVLASLRGAASTYLNYLRPGSRDLRPVGVRGDSHVGPFRYRGYLRGRDGGAGR
jgi:hypothetical protein